MARYFFALRRASDTLEDDVGEELPSIAEACEIGRRIAGDLARNAPENDLRNATLLVLDEAGTALHQVPLMDVTENAGPRPASRQPAP